MKLSMSQECSINLDHILYVIYTIAFCIRIVQTKSDPLCGRRSNLMKHLHDESNY